MKALLLTSALVVVVSGCGRPDSATGCIDLVDERASRYQQATTPEQLSRVCAEQFVTARDSELSALEAHSSPGVAFAAAWERARRVLVNPATGDRLERYGSMCRFVGFVEGRLRVRTPEAWRNLLFSAQAVPQTRTDVRSWVHFGLPGNDIKSSSTAAIDVATPDSATIIERSGHAYLRVGRQETPLPAEVVDAKDSFFYGGIPEPVLTQDTCVVAVYRLRPYGFPLYCLSRHDGAVQWKEDVWAGGGLEHYEGVGFHRVWLAKDASSVIVFGVGDDAAYIEGFQLNDGTNWFRFCTSYHLDLSGVKTDPPPEDGPQQ
jgi:hypothetical protein